MRHTLAALGLGLLCTCSSTPPVTQCQSPAVSCGSTCATLAKDSANCGSCGVACKADETCAGGMCFATDCGATPCAEWQICSAGACADRECVGVTCPTDQTCARGMCLMNACANQTCGAFELCLNDMCVEAACVGVLCPAGSICFKGRCEEQTCGNGMKDGTETGPDCGGHCSPCADGRMCNVAADCTSRVCNAGTCAPGSCADMVRNGDEADIDCGGSCPLCPSGSRCTATGQCESHVCTGGTCRAPSCTDATKNGNETDVDCGASCNACSDGKTCMQAADCMSNLCTLNKCVPAVCMNGQKDTGESDVDCGGACAGCATGRACATAADCQSHVCGAGLTCSPPNCGDMVANGNETDVDCGGSCTTKCGSGKGCLMGSDCASLVCTMNRCANASCTDAVRNGAESDLNCGGGTCPACSAGKMCGAGTDCQSMVCTLARCTVVAMLAQGPSLAVGTAPIDLAAGQLDTDGIVDVAVANQNSYDITVYFGGDGGTFSPSATLGTTNEQDWHGPKSIAFGDLDGDGNQDIVMARFHSDFNFVEHLDACRIVTYTNLGNRVFGVGREFNETSPESTTSACGHRLATGYFDSDGLADVVVSDTYRYDCPGNCNNCGGGCGAGGERAGGWFWRSTPTGFAAPVRLPQLGSNFTLADLNRDGVPEPVGHNFRFSGIQVFVTDAGTPVSHQAFASSMAYGDIVAARFDTDAELDLAWASRETNQVAVAKGVAGVAFAGAVNYPVTGAATMAVADLDRDGKVDLIVGTAAGIAIMRGNGDGTFQSAEANLPALGAVGPLRIADFNGDGKLDVGTIAMGQLQILYNITP